MQDLVLRISFNNLANEEAPYATATDLLDHIRNFSDESGNKVIEAVVETTADEDRKSVELQEVLSTLTRAATEARSVGKSLDKLYWRVCDGRLTS